MAKSSRISVARRWRGRYVKFPNSTMFVAGRREEPKQEKDIRNRTYHSWIIRTNAKEKLKVVQGETYLSPVKLDALWIVIWSTKHRKYQLNQTYSSQCLFIYIFKNYNSYQTEIIKRNPYIWQVWFFDFFQISYVHPKPYTGRHICAKFGVNRSSDSFN